MPRLHKYRDRNACYILTAIRGSVATFQLTADGERKLAAAGVACGQQFPRALLLDLYRTGDAFTGGGGLAEAAPDGVGQLELDFVNDPDPESAFPVCDVCRSVEDLHLLVSGPADERRSEIHCAACRASSVAKPEVSLPTVLVSRHLLARLCQLKAVEIKSPNVLKLEELLRAEFESKWTALRRRMATVQTSLFQAENPGDLGLS